MSCARSELMNASFHASQLVEIPYRRKLPVLRVACLQFRLSLAAAFPMCVIISPIAWISTNPKYPRLEATDSFFPSRPGTWPELQWFGGYYSRKFRSAFRPCLTEYTVKPKMLINTAENSYFLFLLLCLRTSAIIRKEVHTLGEVGHGGAICKEHTKYGMVYSHQRGQLLLKKRRVY